MTGHDEKDDAALIQAAIITLSNTDESGADEAEMSRVWLRARLASLAGRDRPAEALIGVGLVASAGIAGLAALGLTAAFWGSVYESAPLAALVAVVSLTGLALLGALAFRT